METAGKKCFVIMPYGSKPDPENEGATIDFDEIYNHLIKKTVEVDLKMDCERCDMIDESGWVHEQMFKRIYQSEVAIVDLTSLNPNVFYELGIRHALVESVTILILREGTTKIPFNIQGFKVIKYNPAKMSSVDEAREKIAGFIRNGLDSRNNDSPVHQVLDLKIEVPQRTIDIQQKFTYQLPNGKKIGLITGDLRDVRGVDIWVNSENTNMQMARFFDRSISSVIRYCGAEKDEGGNVTKDIIADELTALVGQNGSKAPGTIIVTGAGELSETNDVRKIFHAAAVQGQPGAGYVPVNDIAACIKNALKKADHNNYKDDNLKSILFPLMGTGTGRGELEEKAAELINAAVAQLVLEPPCKIESVYFLARTKQDLEVCQRIIQQKLLEVEGRAAKHVS